MMDSKERLEREVMRAGGEHGGEIIESVKALAEIDIRIKGILDEIERLDEELVRKHNEIADRINSLIEKSVDGNSDDGAEELLCRKESNQSCPLKIEMEIHVTEVM